MRRHAIIWAGVVSLLAARAWAQTCTAYPTILANGTTADANAVMGNFYCAALLGGANFTGDVAINNAAPSTGAMLSITPTGADWNEGIEINPSTANGYSALALRTTANSITGGWELTNTNTTDPSGPHSLDFALNGLTGMIGTGRADAPFSITTSGVTRFGGAVGILSSAPTDALDVMAPVVFGGATERLSLNTGSIGFNRKVANGQIYNSSYYAYQFQHTDGTTATGDFLGLQIYAPSGANVTGAAIAINGAGQVSVDTVQSSYAFYVNGSAAGTTGWTNASDVRLKTDITEITGALDLVQRLRGVRFHWRAPKDRGVGRNLTLPVDEPQVGFVAQEVAKVVPEAVSAPRPGSDEPYGVRDSSLVPILLEAIKEQQKEIEALQAEIYAISQHTN